MTPGHVHSYWILFGEWAVLFVTLVFVLFVNRKLLKTNRSLLKTTDALIERVRCGSEGHVFPEEKKKRGTVACCTRCGQAALLTTLPATLRLLSMDIPAGASLALVILEKTPEEVAMDADTDDEADGVDRGTEWMRHVVH